MTRRRRLLLVALMLPGLGACAADRGSLASAPVDPPARETRTGVPVLMDLPILGWLFQHRRTAR